MPPFDAATCGLRRKIIGQFYMENWTKGKTFTFKHFQIMKVPKATAYRIMRQCDEGVPMSRKSGSGRPAQKMPPGKCQRLQAEMKEKIGASQSHAARKYGISQQYVSKILKSKTSLRYRKRQPAPDVTEAQKIRQKTACTKLRKGPMKSRGNTIIIMDDETYFTLKSSSCVANKGFYTSDRKSAPSEVRFVKKQKFPKKIMLWMAISSEGMSDPLFLEQDAMNGDIYENKCIPLVNKFIKTHHRDKNVIFWPDLATAHYKKSVTKKLEDLKIPTVARAHNPPAAPQIRPIEHFWSQLKQAVYKDGWEASTASDLKRRVRAKLRQFNVTTVQNLMRGLKTKVRRVSDGGHEALLKL